MGWRIALAFGLMGLVGVLAWAKWYESLRPRDLRVVSLEVARVHDFPEIKDLPAPDREVLKITFTSGQDFQSYMVRHETRINVDAYPCGWTSRDESNDRLGLSYFLYDQHGEVNDNNNRGRHFNSKRQGSPTAAAVYHFYASLLPWNVGSRSYDLIKKPEDVCFSLFVSGNAFGLSYDQHIGGTAPPFSSEVVLVPKRLVVSAVSNSHLR